MKKNYSTKPPYEKENREDLLDKGCLMKRENDEELYYQASFRDQERRRIALPDYLDTREEENNNKNKKGCQLERPCKIAKLLV